VEATGTSPFADRGIANYERAAHLPTRVYNGIRVSLLSAIQFVSPLANNPRGGGSDAVLLRLTFMARARVKISLIPRVSPQEEGRFVAKRIVQRRMPRRCRSFTIFGVASHDVERPPLVGHRSLKSSREKRKKKKKQKKGKETALSLLRDVEHEAQPEKKPLLKQAKRRNLQPYISDKGRPRQL
jgi:hypothetical protein